MVAGFAVAAVLGVGLSLEFVTGEPLRNAGWSLLVRLAMWTVVWAAGVACALRLPRRLAVPAVLAVGLALRLASLAGQPILSDDLYRYSWDGRVQVSGTDPYRYPPNSARLESLREDWLWPDAEGCARLQRPEGCTRINRAAVNTIYPPLAQAWFTAVYRVAGIGAHHKAWQVAGLLGDMALVALLPALLRAYGRDERWTALYALSPIPVVEVVNNGHVDGLAALFAVLALLAFARRRPGWAGALVGAAAMVKLYPALLGLAFVAVVGIRRRGPLVRLVGGAVAVVALSYLPHVAAVGLRVLGYLPGYLREERYAEGGRYLLTGALGLPTGPTAALAGAGVVVVAGWVLLRRPDVPRGCAALLGALLLAVTPVQPWYAVTLLAVATVAARPAWSALAVAGYPYFFAVLLDSPHAVVIGRVSFGLALFLVGLGGRLYPPPPHADDG
ncbi:MAG: glycosyltransferase 87 family protein [Acidimicrobiales bacterium]